MAEYIEKVDIRNALYDADAITMEGVKILNQFPAADVAPVRHGKWVRKKEWHLGRWVAWLECSCCGERDDNCEMYDMLPFGAEPSNYCPNCGARMDGGDNNG